MTKEKTLTQTEEFIVDTLESYFIDTAVEFSKKFGVETKLHLDEKGLLLFRHYFAGYLAQKKISKSDSEQYLFPKLIEFTNRIYTLTSNKIFRFADTQKDLPSKTRIKKAADILCDVYTNNLRTNKYNVEEAIDLTVHAIQGEQKKDE